MAQPPRIRAWQATLVLIFGGLGAQVAGAIAAAMFGAFLLFRAGPVDLMDPAALTMALQGLITDPLVFGAAILVTGGTTILSCVFLAALVRVPIKEALGFKSAHWSAFLVAPVGMLALGPSSDFLRQQMQTYLPNFTLHSLDSLEGLTRAGPLWLLLFLMAVVPGVSEEVLFRGLFQRSIRSKSLAILLSGVVFALYHGDPHHVAAVLPLGLYLAFLGARTASVLVPMVAHIFNNGAAVLFSRFSDPNAIEQSLPWWAMPTGWIICALCMVWIYRISRQSIASTEVLAAAPG